MNYPPYSDLKHESGILDVKLLSYEKPSGIAIFELRNGKKYQSNLMTSSWDLIRYEMHVNHCYRLDVSNLVVVLIKRLGTKIHVSSATKT